MEPGAQGIPNPQAAGLLDQDQERGLEGILCVVRVDERGAADAQNHRPVALHQGLESQFGDLAPARREPLQQLSVRKLPDRPEIEERVELP